MYTICDVTYMYVYIQAMYSHFISVGSYDSKIESARQFFLVLNKHSTVRVCYTSRYIRLKLQFASVLNLNYLKYVFVVYIKYIKIWLSVKISSKVVLSLYSFWKRNSSAFEYILSTKQQHSHAKEVGDASQVEFKRCGSVILYSEAIVWLTFGYLTLEIFEFCLGRF